MAKSVLIVLSCLWCAMPAAAQDKYFDSNGVQIRYVDVGAGEPIILLHGFAGNLDRGWIDTGVLPNLQKDFRVIAMDSRGHGKSGKPHNPDAYGIEMTRDVVRLLDHLKLAKAHIVGYSFGGLVVTKLLITNPERFLTAIIGGYSGRPSPEDSEVNEKEAQEIAQGSQRSLMMRLAPPGQPPSEEAIREASERLKASADLAALAAIVRARPRLWVPYVEMSNVRVRALAIAGSLDPNAAGLPVLKKAIPMVKTVVIDGAVHSPAAPNGTPRQPQFVEAIRSFISSSESRR